VIEHNWIEGEVLSGINSVKAGCPTGCFLRSKSFTDILSSDPSDLTMWSNPRTPLPSVDIKSEAAWTFLFIIRLAKE